MLLPLIGMHDGHERETEYYHRAVGDLVQSERLLDTKKTPETIKYLQESQMQAAGKSLPYDSPGSEALPCLPL